MPNHHRIITLKWLHPFLILAFGLTILGSGTAFLVVDCRPQSGKPSDPNLCNGIIAGPGNNHITVDPNQTVKGPFFGDGVLGNGGNDILINNGTTVAIGEGTGRNGDIEGDVAGGNGGDDVIVNNGTVAGDMDGDTALGDGGDDVLINNGRVGDDMDGDNARRNGGDDLIINNGIVGGDIQADDNEDVAGSIGGNDIIVINGTVEGYVDGDAGVKKGGDDLVILQNGADGGDDHTLTIDGGGGDDTLAFNFIVPDQATLDDLSTQIANRDPARDSLIYNGQTFQWRHFEHLDNRIVVQSQNDALIMIPSGQSRAALDRSGAALYCVAGKLSVVGFDHQNRSEWLFTIKAADLKRNPAQADGQTLSTTPSGQMELTDAAGRYKFMVAGDFCAN